jgi:hypothetical protein
MHSFLHGELARLREAEVVAKARCAPDRPPGLRWNKRSSSESEKAKAAQRPPA